MCKFIKFSSCYRYRKRHITSDKLLNWLFTKSRFEKHYWVTELLSMNTGVSVMTRNVGWGQLLRTVFKKNNIQNRKKKKNATLSLTGTDQDVWRPSAPLSLSKWNKNAFVWIVQGKPGQKYYCAWCLEVGQTISITICHNAFCYDGTIDRLAPWIDNFIKTCKDLMHFPASLTYQSHYLMILLDWSHQMKDDKVTKVIKDDVRKKCTVGKQTNKLNVHVKTEQL